MLAPISPAQRVARRGRPLFAMIMVCAVTAAAETPLEVVNAGFEQQMAGWSNHGDRGMSRIVGAAARTGELGLRVVDTSSTYGSSLRAAAVAVQPGRYYALRFWGRAVASGSVGVYLQFFDADRQMLNRQELRNELALSVPGSQKTWKQFTLVARAPETAAQVDIWVHSYNGSQATADLDDFSLAELSDEEIGAVKTTPTRASRGRTFPVPTTARIAEIAALLRPEPAGVGRPIADRETWDRLAADKSAAKIIASAVKIAKESPPELPDDLYLEFTRTGNRTNYQRPYGQRTSRLGTLLKAECFENKGRFIPAIQRDILAICDERSWVMPAHDSGLSNFHGKALYADLGSSARSWLLATADYWLGDCLGREVRRRIRAEIRRRTWDPYLKTLRSGTVASGFWWMVGSNNWNAVCNAGVVGSALALIESREERAEFIAGMEVSNPYFLGGFTADGYCSEGMGYWNYGFGHYMMLGEMVLAVTDGRLSIYDHETLPSIAAFARNIQVVPGLAPAFADCSVNARPSTSVMALIARRFPQALWGPVEVNAAAAGVVTLGLFTAAPPSVEGPAGVGLPLRSWFADAGILVSRAVQTDGLPSFGVAVKGGHNAEHHNHNDVGSFTVILGGKPYLLDPGGEVYTQRTFSSQRYVSKMLNSYGHPVPVVGGKLQSKGRHAAAKVLETAFGDALDRLVIDFADAYAVPELTRLVRTFEHDRVSRSFVVEDYVEFRSPQTFETALVTYEKVFRRDVDTFVVHDASACLEIDVAVDAACAWDAGTETIENPGKPSPTRLAFRLAKPITTARIRFTITAAALGPDIPGIYHAPDMSAHAPDLADAACIQAEDFRAQRGGEATVCNKVGDSGRSFKFWDDRGHALEWEFELPRAGRYAVLVRCCHASAEPVTRLLLIDGEPLPGAETPLLFPHTGGWSSTTDNWRDLWLAHDNAPVIVSLERGRHRLTLTNDCGIGLNLDWIKLVPLARGE